MDKDIQTACIRMAAVHNYEPELVMAFVDVESGGQPWAIINGRREPIARFEGHYMYRRAGLNLTEKKRDDLRAKLIEAGLASPDAGKVKNPESQQDRWDKLIRPAMALDKDAALESTSWGLGQVMGANWKLLGYASVQAFYDAARNSVEDQVDQILRFIDKSGLRGALIAHQWAVLAAGYNGKNYAQNKYDQKLADAYKKYRYPNARDLRVDPTVEYLQQRLVTHGFAIKVDGIRGAETNKAILDFQKKHGLVVDGIVGSHTWEELNKDPVK